MRKYFTIFAALFLSLLMSDVYAAEAKDISNLTCAKSLIKNYYESGDYDKEVAKILQEAKIYLQNRIVENNRLANPKQLAIVLDIDDTSLSNFPALKKDDFSLLHLDDNHIHEDEPAILPMLAFYKIALANNVKMFFISLRSDELRQDTIKHLEKAGYANWSGLFLPKEGERSPAYKANVRKMLMSQGDDIVLNIGDQQSDLEGGYADKIFKLPNPMYSTYAKPCESATVSCQ